MKRDNNVNTNNKATLLPETIASVARAADRVRIEGEALGLPKAVIETAQAVAIGTYEGGKLLR